jgi:hypothetical protein
MVLTFEEYDRRNPKIWVLFVKYAKQAKYSGRSKYSAKSIFEVIRWNETIAKNGRFKVDNNFAPFYARKMMAVYPDFEGFFFTRKSKV